MKLKLYTIVSIKAALRLVRSNVVCSIALENVQRSQITIARRDQPDTMEIMVAAFPGAVPRPVHVGVGRSSSIRNIDNRLNVCKRAADSNIESSLQLCACFFFNQ